MTHEASDSLDRIVLAASEPGGDAQSATDRETVRIFVATEAAQYRAERVFLYSVERHRDPARRYEIFLLKDLPGFRKLFWNTGFTNFRFAVPHYAGYRGRAIYNDVDQIYVSDPGELFDLDLGGHGYLAISETDTSVMLIDCARMGRFWSLEGAQKRRKYGLINDARAVAGTYGRLDGRWNARDQEYEPGQGGCVHFTTIHKQPWHPFPERFHYQENPRGDLWFDMERDADREGYQPFTRSAPSRAGREKLIEADARLEEARGSCLDEAVRDLLDRTGARSLLEVGAAAREPAVTDARASQGLLSLLDEDEEAPARSDGVFCRARLDGLPQADAPWAVEQLFRRADRFVVAAVRCDPPPRRRYVHPPAGTVGQPVYWEWLFRSVGARYPQVHWEVAVTRGAGFDDAGVEFLHGGPFPGGAEGAVPRVWVLTDHKPGHTTQSVGLADELGWPTERFDLSFNFIAELPSAWSRGRRVSLTPESAARIVPPWPDLVIAAGRRAAPIAAWIRRQSCARTRTVQMGRFGAYERDVFDLGVAPAYAGLYPDSRRIETAAPITRVSPAALERAAARWSPELASAQAPRLALLVGGRDPEHELTPEAARRMGEEVAELARREQGSVLVTTSRRTSEAAADALEAALGSTCAHFHRWSADEDPDSDANPYMGLLALADALVVTGESASMLAEACATGKPVYIYPLPRRPAGDWRAWFWRFERRLSNAVAARAFARPVNRRNFERPQQGFELLSARLVARGFVRSRGNTERLHRELIDRGLARRFDGKLASVPPQHLSEVRQVADRVRRLMGFTQPTS